MYIPQELTEKLEYKNNKLYWRASGKKVKTYDKDGYRMFPYTYKKKQLTIREHRAIWTLLKGPIEDGYQIDHINRKKHDNRIENLRLATFKDNQRNKPLSKKNTSGFKGVSYNKLKTRWIATIRVDGKSFNLGSYKKAEEAAAAYNEAAKKYYNEFAWLNDV